MSSRRWSQLAIATAVAVLSVVFTAPYVAAPADAAEVCAPEPGYWLCATLTPAAGPIGTRVAVVGTMPKFSPDEQQNLKDPSYFELLRQVPGTSCEFRGGVTESSVVADFDQGTWRASFTVADEGVCFQQGGQVRRTAVGTYTLNIGCGACSVAEFEVTAATLPKTGTRSEWTLGTSFVALTAIAAGVGLVRPRRRRAGAVAAT